MFGAYYHQQKDSKQLFGPSRSMLQIVNLGYIDPLDQPDPDSSHMLPSWVEPNISSEQDHVRAFGATWKICLRDGGDFVLEREHIHELGEKEA
jgi:hypothetical protein